MFFGFPGLRMHDVNDGVRVLTCNQFALAWSLGGQCLGHVHDPLLLLQSWVQLTEVQQRWRLYVLNTVERTQTLRTTIGQRHNPLVKSYTKNKKQPSVINWELPTWIWPGGSWCAQPGGSVPPAPLDSEAPQSQTLRSALGWELSAVWTAALWTERKSVL